MSSLRVGEWHRLPVSLRELCINTTLRCGQSFRWRKSADDEWSCALHGRILSLRQDPEHLHFRAIFPSQTALPTPPPSAAATIAESIPPDDGDTLDFVKHYLNLGPNLTELYEQWASADQNFRKKAPKFTGVRILKQDAWEALVGFICSSNNNIARISQMMEKLCIHYGSLIGHIGSQAFHDFPPPSALTDPKVEQHLRQLGFGYRAKYLYQTAVMVAKDKGEDWLDSLRNPESPLLGMKVQPAGEMIEGGREGYRKAHEELLALQGVGPKVADCVCLMGLGWGEAVPVDTHVWQIAQRDYKFGKGKHSSLTKATYDAVANRFRSLWGKEAGWAHSVLFTADLKAFAERLVARVEEQVETQAVKVESDGTVAVQTLIKEEAVATKRIKRELGEKENPVLEVQEKVVRRTKRNRKV
ncbi:8-oxoguanine glycosylase ogg1 [Coniosporium apollinis]|uniref:DNA-(apurinic or apyrimidinic site) lyase n=1 Tax=Coniosporium apollinis TaxID=61459 RepID=A0ABQ9P739_9PEZI|nr:8-oxoguanine glycosylase ogg1 [Coniosporium apollinis]